MEVVYSRCAGIDISKTDAKVCVRVQARKGAKTSAEVTTWGATSSQIIALGEHLVAEKVECVVMEATSSYWRPFWHLLSAAGLRLVLANPRQVRQIPGKKTDVADSVWLADLLAHGLVKPSFVAPLPVERLKDLTRTGTALAKMRGQEAQRLEKALESSGIKVSAVVSDLTGASGRRFLAALVGGERDPNVLASLGDKRLKASREELVEALTGRFDAHHAFLVQTHLDLIDSLTAKIAQVEAKIQEFFDQAGPEPGPGGLTGAERADWERKRELLATIPGVSQVGAEEILAEIGPDMSVFPTAKHLVSWGGVAPGLNQSAGKSKPAKAPKGNRQLKGALGRAALSAAKNKGTYLNALYRRVSARRGNMRALVAVENSILTSIWHMLTNGEPYRDLGADYYLKRRPGATIRKAVEQLRAIGYQITFADTAHITATPAVA